MGEIIVAPSCVPMIFSVSILYILFCARVFINIIARYFYYVYCYALIDCARCVVVVYVAWWCMV